MVTVLDLFRHSQPYPLPSPLASPLVVQWGAMSTPGGLFRAWAPVFVVLTVTGCLHVFDKQSDVGAAPPPLPGYVVVTACV